MKNFVFSSNKIKKFFNKKRIFILSISSLTIFLIIFFISSIYGSLCKIWPQNIRSIIAMNRLAISIYKNPVCRDVCFYQQLGYKQEITANIDNKKVYEKLKNTIFNQEENLGWRLESIKVIEESLDKNIYLEDFLNDTQFYIDNENIDEDLEIKQALIFSFYNYLESDSYLKILKNNISENILDGNNKIKSINFLSSLGTNLSGYYLDLLIKENNQKIIGTILKSLGGDIGRFDLDHGKVLPVLENIFLNVNSGFENRRLVIFILSDFIMEDDNQEVLMFLDGLYQNENTDEFSKFLIADTLNRQSSRDYDFPDISDEEWEEYYL
ncbi:hypothetical protein CVU82_02850 [Candidatus Falkowbacteria bacterium HGW-Falkowbacteria-1]|uniref:Uncharacterized protein n=1 Tax=Candidatus Falkowbacteria bacterium HGW-Falkowbacteria-1 TaxID=2013768 RepID=A0A2N2EA02_9BACT|nr:MAG: hypothetical protein CVU82_02850 [Candidatus Falkowbacteria bacterium HGW-Falkowbacteria-1]